MFYSFEYFPPKTDAGVRNLYPRIERMAALEPAFVDITWGAGGSTSELTLSIAENLQKFFGVDVMMHLTCTNMSVTKLDEVLDQVHAAGIRNILALRGDPPRESEDWEAAEGGFSYAHELVSHIRKRFGDEFCIAVAGYPEGHLEAEDRAACIRHLKHKVDCGADFVVTQLFFDVAEYAGFLERAKVAGIECPILPGILPIQSYDRFARFAEFTGVKVPQEIWDRLEPIRQDDSQVRAYGVELAVEICRKLEKLDVPGFHFYTLNLAASVTRILEGLELSQENHADRSLPWKPSALPDRQSEDVRPIFWSNRPKSYLSRTQDWDEFPNGRWGDRRSPSFGNLSDYYQVSRRLGLRNRKARLLEAYGEPQTEQDVFEVFANFCSGKLNVFPWADGDLAEETSRISLQLTALNRAGYLTINSQPQVRGVRSDDLEVGWGGPGGVVYQKAYMEFFASDDRMQKFLEVVDQYPTLTYQAVNMRGDVESNVPEDSTAAVTWGVFPGKEVIQPTIVDAKTFLIWKEEAFEAWQEEWAHLYEEDSVSRKLIEKIQGSYWLINLVENDYLEGDIFSIFRRLEGMA